MAAHLPERPIFLLGPPGVGKSELGARACAGLGWTFGPFTTSDDAMSAVLEVPWEAVLAPRMLEKLRKRGTTIALWGRPERMQARASRPYVLRPSTAIVTPGSFGRRGTTCVEHRRLERGAEHVLWIDGLTLDEAVRELSDVLVDAARARGADARATFAVHLVERWCADRNAPRKSARALAAAMADFLVARRAAGMSDRTRRALESDLQVAGLLHFLYRQDTSKETLASFRSGAAIDTFAFERRGIDRPAAVARYERALAAFAAFLRDRGETKE